MAVVMPPMVFVVSGIRKQERWHNLVERMFCRLCTFGNTGGTYMARNRIIGRETQKMQEYTQEQIDVQNTWK